MADDSVREPLEQERLRLLFTQARPASITALLGAFACMLVLYHAAPGPGPALWFAGICIATAIRFVLYRRFFAHDGDRKPASHWLRRHHWSGGLVGVAWGCLPLVPLGDAPLYAQQLQTLVPGFLVMAAITSYGVFFSQYTTLLLATGVTTMATHLAARGAEGIPEAIIYILFAPIMAITARRYCDSLVTSMKARRHSQHLVERLTEANEDLSRQNTVLNRQRNLLEKEEELAKHVFGQLIIGGDGNLPGVHTWNQSMGNLSGDLTQTARGPSGQAYVFISDFTGHGLPAALGALPASSIFRAMAGKGLPLELIALELNTKLNQLLPIGYFCCAVLIELAADHRTLKVWNSGMPPVLIKRHGETEYERIDSHGLPLGVAVGEAFDTRPKALELQAGDLVYAFTDGLTEAENQAGEMWGIERLEQFLLRTDLPTPRLPALIDAVLEHVDQAPASDDISIVEMQAGVTAAERADAA